MVKNIQDDQAPRPDPAILSKDERARSGRHEGTAYGTAGVDGTSATTPPASAETTSIPLIELEKASPASSTPEETTKRCLPTSSISYSAETSSASALDPFQALSLDLSSKGLSEELGSTNVKFSARGSMLVDGKKMNAGDQVISAQTMPVIKEPLSEEEAGTAGERAVITLAEVPPPRLMSADEEQLSEKVRAFYSLGTDSTADLDAQLATAKRLNLRWQDAVQDNPDSLVSTSRATSTTDISKWPSSPTIPREEQELAGGVEDWQDVDNADVDRYGFIIPKSPSRSVHNVQNGSIKRTPTSSDHPLQRVSTSLQLAADTPRRKHTIRRTPSNARSTQSDRDLKRVPSIGSLRSTKSANLNRHHSASRALANRFPHNKDRRVLDEAGDMLTLPRSFTMNSFTRTSTDEGTGTSTTTGTYVPSSTPASRRKEIERQAKWQKMATKVPTSTIAGAIGGGMTFTFDTKNPKLVERTWKGIPDTWRATAWHCFLSTSAAKHNKRHPRKPCLSDEELTVMFHAYQDRNCPDDVQIDIDVPRTISSHIMFRRRYRGGQRLLFRVLHALSMHFAHTGYVQGMATLAATLLAYYDEEKSFIMLVRLWELRGLEKLYENGFGGLMEALTDFEDGWLGQGELRKKLDDLMIGPTAYGTRWYLTLFNYSIPFASQLRVWDVFMLLGDDENDHDAGKEDSVPLQSNGEKGEEKANFGSTLDVLHAASAALIDGMREILLEGDFENAMKVLTSWIPIRDEDLFMRVARTEWKMHQQRRKKS